MEKDLEFKRVGRWAVRELVMCELALARSETNTQLFSFIPPFHVSFKFYVNLICLSYEKGVYILSSSMLGKKVKKEHWYLLQETIEVQ